MRLVAIDGPAGSGKSSVSRILAVELNGVMFSSGAAYRGVTLICLDAGIDLQDADQVLATLDEHDMRLERDAHELRLIIDGRDPGDELHSTRVSREIHWIADDPRVRARLLPVQRALARGDFGVPGPVVVEGRDIGTVVFPDADLKVFLTASVDERARRRVAQLNTDFGEQIDEDQVRKDVERRDRFDSERDAAPLKAADDSRVLDTSGLDIGEVVSRIRELLDEGR